MTIQVVNYVKEINKAIILNHISLELEEGLIYGFQGKNGSGKTMLFRAICKNILPTSGDVLINGQSVVKNEFDMRKMGVLIEHPGFFGHLTGYENLKLLVDINKTVGKQEVDDILEKVGLSDAKNKKYSQYSMGMRQRLGIAQAIVENQQYILLDEPFNGIDEQGVQDFINLFIELKKEGKTLLISSHDKEYLQACCDKIYFMRQGEIHEKNND